MKQYDYIPEGFHAITPALTIKNAPQAIEWYKKVFGAKEVMRLIDQDGNIAHAELRLADSRIMLGEENPDYNKGPDTLCGTPVVMNYYVRDVDAVVNRAVDEGATIIFPVNNQFYGDRSGRIQDPFGHVWIISTHMEKMTIEEMQRRFHKLITAQ
jgi:PhnB protein